MRSTSDEKGLKKIYEGKAKILYSIPGDDERIIAYFKDDATAYNGKKKGTILRKGEYNNSISSSIFTLLKEKGIESHFIEKLSGKEMLVYRLKMLPVELVVRNVAAGSLAKKMDVEEGIKLLSPVVEIYFKSDELGDPMINETYIGAFDLGNPADVEKAKQIALKVNDVLKDFFDGNGLILVDYKLEFGLLKGDVVLADEITPDTMRLWDKVTLEKVDKDRFRRDLGGVEEAYKRVYDITSKIKQ